MKRTVIIAIAFLLCAGTLLAQGEQKFGMSGVTYTKWLWGNQRFDGSMYNFTTVPGEGYGDNGQGSEIELLFFGKPNKYIEVKGRIHSRFSQNEWTNFGGFGVNEGCSGGSTGGDCGESDPRSNQYVKLRGVTVNVTPGYRFLDNAQFGSTDLGMFDPFTIGKIRYIDRDNAGAILFQGRLTDSLKYDVIRISTPRLWAGPSYNTGEYAADDSVYGLQMKWSGNEMVDGSLIYERARDIEIDKNDSLPDNGTDVATRFSNDVWGVKVGVHPMPSLDFRGAYYTSEAESDPNYDTPAGFGINGYSTVVAGKPEGDAYILDVDVVDIMSSGLTANFQFFNIDEEYTSIMAARRESDVLITEGFDATFAFPGPSNASYGVFGGNETRIGYGGWQGTYQQVATLNVDNEFTDFDEPAAESAIGWKGFTIIPKWSKGPLELAAEYTNIDYNQNWQMWGSDSNQMNGGVLFPATELDAGIGHNFRSSFAPFMDRSTDILVLKGRYTFEVGKGLEVYGKLKWIDETDKRMNNAKYLPFKAGDCPGGGVACKNDKNFYSGNNSTGDYYGNPPVITVNGVTGYQWKPFNSLSDDDRDLSETMIQLGAGYQFTDVLYASLTYENYDIDLKDGNTAFQAYNLHEMVSGQHDKDKIIVLVKFPIGGVEAGLNYEYATGDFTPEFGDGFVVQYADASTAAQVGVKEGSRGFKNRYGGWNSLEKRDFEQNRLKAFFKVRF
jgi:hypothetical protein